MKFYAVISMILFGGVASFAQSAKVDVDALCGSSVTYITHDSLAAHEFGQVGKVIPLFVIDTLTCEMLYDRPQELLRLFPKSFVGRNELLSFADSIRERAKAVKYCQFWAGSGLSKFSTAPMDSSSILLGVIDTLVFPQHFVQIADVYRKLHSASEEVRYGDGVVISYVFVYDRDGVLTSVTRTLEPTARPYCTTLSQEEDLIIGLSVDYIRRDARLMDLGLKNVNKVALAVSPILTCSSSNSIWMADSVMSMIFPGRRSYDELIDSLWIVHALSDKCIPKIDENLVRLSDPAPNCWATLSEIDSVTSPRYRIIYAEVMSPTALHTRIAYGFIFSKDGEMLKAVSDFIEE